MSHTLFKEKIVPEISKEQPTVLIVIDNLRYDQWKVFEPIINNYYKKDKEEAFFSILVVIINNGFKDFPLVVT